MKGQNQNELDALFSVDAETGEVKETELVAPAQVFEAGHYQSMLSMLDKLEAATPTVRLNAVYYEFNAKGQKLRGLYQGKQNITKNDPSGLKTISCVQLLTKDGLVLNAGASLVEQFDNVPVGTAVEIEFEGTVKTANGFNVKKYAVVLLAI